jgi:hypothetical protein
VQWNQGHLVAREEMCPYLQCTQLRKWYCPYFGRLPLQVLQGLRSNFMLRS